MITFFSLLGFDFSAINTALLGLSLLVGYLIGHSLKSGLKIVLAVLAVVVGVGFVASGVLSQLTPILAMINPVEILKSFMDLATGSVLVVVFIAGFALGLWK
jgi:uncharacterized membrane protein (Fun14 family)